VGGVGGGGQRRDAGGRMIRWRGSPHFERTLAACDCIPGWRWCCRRSATVSFLPDEKKHVQTKKPEAYGHDDDDDEIAATVL
jgi:hypothetical protein